MKVSQKIQRANRKRHSQRGAIAMVFATALFILLMLVASMIARYHDSVVVRKGQAATDAMAMSFLPTLTIPEYADANTAQSDALTLAYLNDLAVANSASEKFYEPLTVDGVELIPQGAGDYAVTLGISLNRKNGGGIPVRGVAEGVPAAAIKAGFVYTDFTRNVSYPGGCLPIAVRESAVNSTGADFTVTLDDTAAADAYAFGPDPRGNILYLSGDFGQTPPEECLTGSSLAGAANTGDSATVELATLAGRIVIFPVVDNAGEVLSFARAELVSVTAPPPFVPPATENGLQSGDITFRLVATAVSPSAVRGDGLPAGAAIPAPADFGQVLRARIAN